MNVPQFPEESSTCQDPRHVGMGSLSVLFLAALLSGRRDLDLASLLDTLTGAPEFDIGDEAALANYFDGADPPKDLTRRPLGPFRDISRRQAERKAREWDSNGVFILSKSELIRKGAPLPECPDILFAWGKRAACENIKIAVLSSRQSLSRIPHSPFLETIKSTVLTNLKPGHCVVSSYSTAVYDAVATLNRGALTIIVCPGHLPFMDNGVRLEQFRAMYDGFFDFQNTLFLSPVPPGFPVLRGEVMSRRDRLVAGLAEAIFAVDIRPNGNMEKIVGHARDRGVPVKIVNSFSPRQPGLGMSRHKMTESGCVGCGPSGSKGGNVRPRDRASTARKNTKVAGQSRIAALLDSRPDAILHLYHYTRSAPGPWPGQSLGEYWNSILDNDPHSRHSGRDTLRRILSEKRIRASARLIRSSEPVVCFSAQPPEKLPSLIKWRRGLRRWTVEPYGIGIDSTTLEKIGAKAVVYAMSDQYDALPSHEKFLFQARRSKGYLWADELEWRLRGDLQLNGIPSQNVVVLVARFDDIPFIQSCCDYRIICAESFLEQVPLFQAHPSASALPSP